MFEVTSENDAGTSDPARATATAAARRRHLMRRLR